MKKLKIFLVFLVAIGLAPCSSEADSITFDFNTMVSSSGITPVSSFGTLTFTDSGNFVDLSVNLFNSNYKILGLDLNFDNSKFSNWSSLSLANESLFINENAIKADGYAGRFDIAIPKNGNIGEWGKYSDTIKWNNGKYDLSISDFTFKDTANQIYAALHIGNYNGGSSLWLGATPSPVSIPEPATLVLLGLGLICIAFFSKKLKSLQPAVSK